MFVVDLICADSHLFEGWYDNRDAFDEARQEHGLTCPVCNTSDVELRPNFRGIVMGSAAAKRRTPSIEPSETTPTTMTPPPMPLEMQRALSQLIKVVKANTEDAGEQFATRALAMHKGDEQPAAIHGTSTHEERQLLKDEGVTFTALPVPEIDLN